MFCIVTLFFRHKEEEDYDAVNVVLNERKLLNVLILEGKAEQGPLPRSAYPSRHSIQVAFFSLPSYCASNLNLVISSPLLSRYCYT